MANGKAPGPDGLGAEFYKEFEDMLAANAHRDARQRLPITLLNVDYKIMSKALVKRLNDVMDEIISDAQLGFVPGRIITEATHALKLLQAIAEEEDGEGIVVAADWEKAFDRVSWDYLHQATEALGFGPKFRQWVHVMYNKDHPPTRRVKANGMRGERFPILSGTPQGCPASPLIFLLVAEALTRLVEGDRKIEGYVTKKGVRTKLSQFADDTQFILKGVHELRRVWKHIKAYEKATGMKANAKKFEGFRLGKTKKQDLFWEKLYLKAKQIVAGWKDTARLTTFGKTAVSTGKRDDLLEVQILGAIHGHAAIHTERSHRGCPSSRVEQGRRFRC